MADNWEDRLAAEIKPSGNWEDRLKSHDFSPPPNPADSGNTIQIFNPFGKNLDTGIPIGATTQNALAGVGKAFSDLGKGIAQKLGGYSFNDAKDTARRDAPLMNTTAGKAGNIGGTVAALLPTAFIPGANTLAGAAAIGAGTGFVQPATSGADLLTNTGVGAVAAPLGNIAGRGVAAGYGLVKSTVSPFFKSGRDAMVADTLSRFVPDKARALAALAGDAGEIVPGSLPTAAEATQLPGVAQLTKQVQGSPGTGAQQAFADRFAANNAARVAAVRDVAGDPGQRAFFAANRDATADQLYSAARAKGIDPAALTPEALQNIAAFQARLPPEVLRSAQQIAKISGTPMTDATSLDGMHWTKMALDGLIAKEAGPGGNPALLRAYSGLKNDLLSGMDALSPDYAAARKTFAAMSKPINQMDVGQALTDKLIPAINDFGGNANLRASGFAQAMRTGDAVAQKVTGMPRATIADVLDPAQVQKLNSVAQDLARSGNASRLAQAPGSDTIQNSISQNILRQTLGPLGLPESAAKNTLLQSILRPAQFVGHLAEPQLMDQLGTTLLDPKAFAAALQRAGKKGLLTRGVDGLLKYGAPLGVSQAPMGLLASPELAQ